MLAPIEAVATLALVYRTCAREHYGSHPTAALLDDLRSDRGRVSFAAMLGSNFEQTDADLVEIIERAGVRLADPHSQTFSPVPLVRELAPLDPFRTEALLHAWPYDPREEVAAEEWAQPYVERWELVDVAMTGLEPLTWTNDQMADIEDAAVALAHDDLRRRLDRLEDDLRTRRERFEGAPAR